MKTCIKTSKRVFAFLLTFLFVTTSGLMVLPTQAASVNGIEVYTSNTYIQTQAGESLSYPLTVVNSSSEGQYVDVSANVPDDWTNTLKSGSYIVKQIYVAAGSTASLTLAVSIPNTTSNGTYPITVTADSATLDLSVDVAEIEDGASSLSVDYPDLTGTASTSFTFPVDLANNHAEDTSYSLEASAPDGWVVTFTPSGSSDTVASLTVTANTNQTINVSVTAPEFTEEGSYTIPITVRSGSETLKQDLTVEIQGSYDMTLSTPSGKLSEDATAGQEKMIKLTIQNTGSSALDDIQLTSSDPTDWEVRFENDTIDTIAAGDTATVVAYVKPASKAISGDYVVSITAKNSDVSSTASFRITVRTSTIWGAVGIGLIVIVVILLGLIMKKYGRR